MTYPDAPNPAPESMSESGPESGPESAPESLGGKKSYWRYLPFALIALVIATIFATGLDDYVTLQALRENREMLAGIVAANRTIALLGFIFVYAGMIVFVPPSGTVMTLLGGFLFGWLWAGSAIVVGATLGATGLFLATRTAFGGVLRARAGSAIDKMEAGFRKNAASYMLFLRLVPVFPFFVVNLVPAFLGVPLRVFVWTTAVGIIPGTFVYASLGASLGAIIDERDPDLGLIFEPQYLLPLIGLALLSLLPVMLKGRRTE